MYSREYEYQHQANTLAHVYTTHIHIIYAGSFLLSLTIHTYKANHSKYSLSSAILRSACVYAMAKPMFFSWLVRVSQPFICCCLISHCFHLSLPLYIRFICTRFFCYCCGRFCCCSHWLRAVFPLHVNVAMARLHLTFTQIRTLRCLLMPTFVAIVRLHNIFDWH